MPDMHSSIYSIMQDNLKSELKYYPVLGFSDAGFFSKKTLGLCHKPHKTLIIQNFALQSGYAAVSYSELCFAKRSATAASFFAVHWSKHFATQNGLRPPRFLRGAYFAVHKRQRSSLFLTAPFSSGCILCGSLF